MDDIRLLQEKIVRFTRVHAREINLSPRVIEAFFKIPRHEFVDRFYRADLGKWIDLNNDNLKDHLSYIYRDSPLPIFRDEIHQEIISTISQPSFVLLMLELLQIKAGQRIFELGTGSGWSAALMAELIGREGQVDTMEIIPELHGSAQERLKKWPQVRALLGDGTNYPESVETHEQETLAYDRVVFTAGSYELPRFLFSKVNDGGLLLFVLRDDEGYDILFLFRKTFDHFHAIRSIPCSFVPAQGQVIIKRKDEFLHDLHQHKLRLEDFQLDVYPHDISLQLRSGQRLSKKAQSQFLWTQNVSPDIRELADLT